MANSAEYGCDDALSSDDIAIETYFRAYFEEVRAYFLKRFQDPDVGDELAHESFNRLLSALRGLPMQPLANPRAYLFGIARNVAMDHLRRRYRDEALQATEMVRAGAASYDTDAERHIIARAQLRVVQAALLELPLRTRQVFAMTRLKRMRYRQTAELLSISESSVQKHLARAVAHVSRRLREHDAA